MTRGICNDIYNRINVTRHLAPLLTLTFLRLSLPSLFSSTFQSAFHFSSPPFVYLLVPACLFPLLNDFGNGFSTILPPTFSHSVCLTVFLSLPLPPNSQENPWNQHEVYPTAKASTTFSLLLLNAPFASMNASHFHWKPFAESIRNPFSLSTNRLRKTIPLKQRNDTTCKDWKKGEKKRKKEGNSVPSY